MITLNDYLYSGDTVFKIIQNYMRDLRKEAKRTHNEIDLVHSNCLLQVMEMLEHNDFLTSQSQKIREFYKYMAKEFPFLAFTFRGRIKSLISGYYRISNRNCIAEMSPKTGTESRRGRDEISLPDSQCAAGILRGAWLYGRTRQRRAGEYIRFAE